MPTHRRARRRARSRRQVRSAAPLWQRLVAGSSTWIGLILLGLIVVFSLLDPSAFVDTANARNIATDAAVLLVLATGMTFVIITAGIDLSVGGVLVFSGVVAAKAHARRGRRQLGRHLPRPRRRARGGLAWGLINGFLVAKAQDPGLRRHPRHAGRQPRRRARHHGRRRRARGAVQAHHDDRHRTASRPDPVPRPHRLRGGDRLRLHPRRTPASAATPSRSAPTRRRRAAPASPSTATSSRSTRSPARSPASPASCRWRASRRRRSPATTPTTCRPSPPSSSAARACSAASGRCSARSSASSSPPSCRTAS